MLINTQDRGTVCAKHAIGSETILGAPDGTPGDVGQVEARFVSFGDSVNLGAESVHGLGQTYYRLENLFGHKRWNS
jgi:tetrahydrodipicolinate N-succinyltransferase